MSTVSSPAPSRKPLFPVAKSSTRVSEPCWTCGTPISPCPDNASNFCRACKIAHAQAEANALRGTLRDLLTGRGIFAVLKVSERLDQAAQVLDLPGMDSAALIELGAIVADQLSARLPVPVAPVLSVTELATEQPTYDAHGYRPSDAERDEHESHFEMGENDVPPVAAYFQPLDHACGIDPRPAA